MSVVGFILAVVLVLLVMAWAVLGVLGWMLRMANRTMNSLGQASWLAFLLRAQARLWTRGQGRSHR